MDDKEPAVSLTSCSYSMYPNPLGFPALLVTSRISLILPCCNNKIALYLSVNVFSTKALIENLCHLQETGRAPLYVVIRVTRRSSRLQGKGSTFISQLF